MSNKLRRILVIAALTAALLMIAPFSMYGGSADLTIRDIFNALLCRGNSANIIIVRELCLPQMLLALLCGAALGLAGAILQSVLHNDLASPDILGISAGGGMTGLIMLLYFPHFAVYSGIAAFAGAFAAAMLIYFTAWKRGCSPGRLILSGVALSSLFGAFSTILLLLNQEKLVGIFDFTLGSFTNKSWEELKLFSPCIISAFAGATLLGKRLDILALGDENAASLGLNVEMTRSLALAVAALAAAGTAGCAGLLSFAGLIAPHTARLLGNGGMHRYMLSASALLGALLVICGDWLGRLLPEPPTELPAGVFLSVAGSLFFLMLLLNSHRSFK